MSSHHEPFLDKPIKRFIAASTAATIIFSAVVWLNSVHQNTIDALRIAAEAKQIAIENQNEMRNKADKKDVEEIRQDIRDFRKSFEDNLRTPDLVIRYPNRRRKK